MSKKKQNQKPLAASITQFSRKKWNECSFLRIFPPELPAEAVGGQQRNEQINERMIRSILSEENSCVSDNNEKWRAVKVNK